MVKGRLHSFETFGAVDGPGIRTVVFLQGCPARCIYCHNPDSWDPKAGREVETEEIVKVAKRAITYYGKDGGVTFSGGEPLLQGEFLVQTIRALEEEGINSIIDTSATYMDEFTEAAIDACQMVLLDVKHSDPSKFKEIAGTNQSTLLKIIDLINKHKKPVWIRQVIVPGINDTEDNIEALNEFIKRVSFVDKVELLPYHTMAADKYDKLGIINRLKNLESMDKEKVKVLNNLVKY